MNEVTPIFVNGYLERTDPELNDYYEQRNLINHAVFIVSDGIKYNLEDIKSIQSIKVPLKFKSISWDDMGVTGYLDYILRMKASELRNRKENELSICVLKKANEIMYASPIGWLKKDYMRLVKWLYEDGRFNEADLVEDEINYNFRDDLKLKRRKSDLKRYTELGYDLTMTNTFNGCCSECAKYRKRVYSISGNDKRFHKVPLSWDCTCQGLVFLLFAESSTSAEYFPDNDYIGYSNRPFVDDRTDEEKRLHQHFIDRQIYEEIHNRDVRNYNFLRYFLPEDTPKSMSAYSRMRNNNTLKFRELVEKAKEFDIDIDLSDNERIAIERYLNFKKEMGWN